MRAYLSTWLAALAGTVREKTWDGYESLIRIHINPVIGDLVLSAVQPADVQHVLTTAAKNGKSASTRNQIRCLMFSAFEKARKEDVIQRNPSDVIPAPKGIALDVQPLPDLEIDAFLKAIQRDKLYALWLGYLASGARRGELLAIDRHQDLRFEKRGKRAVAVVTIRRSLQRVRKKLVFTFPKTPKGYRTLELPTFMTAPLKAHLREIEVMRKEAGPLWEESGLLFPSRIGTPLDPQNVLHRFQKLIGAKRRIHAMRHTVISTLLRRNVDIKTVQEFAGHSRASITHNTYAHLLPGTSGHGAKAMESALGKRVRKR